MQSNDPKADLKKMYVALSRVNYLNEHYLVDKFKDWAIRADPVKAQEYHRLWTLKQLTSIDILGVSNASLTFTLLNVLALNKHAVDIKHYNRLLNTDVLCLTET